MSPLPSSQSIHLFLGPLSCVSSGKRLPLSEPHVLHSPRQGPGLPQTDSFDLPPALTRPHPVLIAQDALPGFLWPLEPFLGTSASLGYFTACTCAVRHPLTNGVGLTDTADTLGLTWGVYQGHSPQLWSQLLGFRPPHPGATQLLSSGPVPPCTPSAHSSYSGLRRPPIVSSPPSPRQGRNGSPPCPRSQRG